MKIAALVLVSVIAVLVVTRIRPPATSAAFVPVAAATPQPQQAPLRRSAASDSAHVPLVVDVAGAVSRPGLVTLPPGARVDAAVKQAIPLAAADLAAVNLAAHAVDGEEIVVPRIGDDSARTRPVSLGASESGAEPRSSSGHHRKHARHSRKRARVSAPASPVDLNRAGAAELATVPGIGAGLAERIVAFREENGPFSAVDDLSDVAGVSERALSEMSPYLRVGP